MNNFSYFDVFLQKENKTLDRLSLPMPGNHNISNSLAAIAIARHLNIDENSIKESLSLFKGVNRRFTQVADLNGIKIIDDYGHHPVEISAVLRAARQTVTGKVFAIHQPHRYTRLNSLFEDFCSCFNEADFVGIMDVYLILHLVSNQKIYLDDHLFCIYVYVENLYMVRKGCLFL